VQADEAAMESHETELVAGEFEPEPTEEVELAAETSVDTPVAADEEADDVPDWLRNLEIAPEEAAAAIDAVFEMPEPEPEQSVVEDEITNEWMQELPEKAPVAEEEAQSEPEEPITESQPESEGVDVEIQPISTAPVVEATPEEISIDTLSTLNRAKTALNRGKPKDALVDYLTLIKHDQALEEIVQDLENALYQHPVDIDLWQAMGDAYAHSKRLQDALNAYTKAEELLR
jgi:tetratricopeptide (TPR) repeat protein